MRSMPEAVKNAAARRSKAAAQVSAFSSAWDLAIGETAGVLDGGVDVLEPVPLRVTRRAWRPSIL
jgi:hypothetical protein